MTDENSDKTAAEAAPATGTAAKAAPAPNSLSTSNKAFWAGVGIGSAALVAALMYSRRPKKKK